MNHVAELQTGKHNPRGRVDHDKQYAVIKLDAVKDKVDYLIELHKTAETASEDFAAAIKTVAEKSGLLASVVRRYIVARAGEKFTEKKRECEQLQLLFDDVGE